MREIKKTKARLEILRQLMSFPTIRSKDWESVGDNDVQIGDLVSLSSAPASKWYVSWVREIKNKNGWTQFLLESIDDGALCWWSNVGINVYDRERVKNSPTWQWDDKQFAFYRRWLKVAKRNDAYILLPVPPIFGNDNSVTLNVRVRHGFSDYSNPKVFLDWKKLLMKEMDAYYKECVRNEEASNKGKPATLD